MTERISTGNGYNIYIFSFLLPFLIMSFSFSVLGIYPLGYLFGNADGQIMVIDGSHQYYPFLQELHSRLLNGESLLYSFNSGGGTNFLALMSYYASTPVYLLSALFPEKYLREFMVFATLLKIGCSGLFFSIYLCKMFNRRDMVTTAFSVLYALSAFAVGYYWCLMWLDVMALLPLVILGLDKLIAEGKFKLYSISLAASVFCNFYIAFFVVLFTFFYYFVLYFSKYNKDTRHFIITTVKVLVFSLLGIGMSAMLLLPAFYAVRQTASAAAGFPETIQAYNTMIDIFTNLLANVKPAVREGLPNISCGLIAVIFGIYYFINNKFTKRERVLNGSLLLFLAFSFNINILNFIWHGFHFTNEIPHRFAFVFSFLLLTLAYQSFNNIDEIPVKTIFTALGFLGAFVLLAETWYASSNKFDFKVFYVNIILIIIYALFIGLHKYGKITLKFFVLIIFLIAVSEASLSALGGSAETGTTERNGYQPEKEDVRQAVAQIYTMDGDFYRLETRTWHTQNDPALYKYRGISQFSSMTDSRFTRIMEIFGISANPRFYTYLYTPATPVFNMVMSLKYMFSVNKHSESPVFDKISENKTRTVRVYENKYWLPAGFFVNDNIMNWEIKNYSPGNYDYNTFLSQNDFMRKAANINGDIFTNIHPVSEEYENVDVSPGDYGVYAYTNINKNEKGRITHKFRSDKSRHVFVYIKTNRAAEGEREVTVETPGLEHIYSRADLGITIDCGLLLPGQEITVKFNVTAANGGNFNIYAVSFDEELFKEGYDYIASNPFKTTSFIDTNIKGIIQAKENGLLFMSLPYNEGWRAKIDGKPVKITALENAFVTIPVSEGEHEVEFSYFTPGLKGGIIITLMSLAIFTFFAITKFGLHKFQ